MGPRLIGENTGMIKANFHTHSVFCDGSHTPEAVAAQGYEYGMTNLGFSGHMDPDIHMDWPAYVAEVRRQQELYRGKMDILLGVELDTLYPKFAESNVNYLPQIYEDAEYIIGSTHFLDVDSEEWMSVDSSPENFQRLCDEFYGGDFYALAKAYYDLEATVVDRLHPTFIGHFDLVSCYNDKMHAFDEEDPRYVKAALEAMEYLVKEKNAIFEINCGAVNRGRKEELYPRQNLLKALHDFGGEIVLSADAHQKEKLLGAFDLAIERAKAAGFDHANILKHDEDGNVVWETVSL